MGNACCGRKSTEDSFDNNELHNSSSGTPLTSAPATSVRKSRASTSKRRVVKALYTYAARADSDITFQKGDRMEVIDVQDKDWWKVLHLGTKQEGYVPANYVADENTVECEDWFFPDVSRKEAETLLLAASNPPGTFLIRPAGGDTHGYSLSVVDWENEYGYLVKHYKIQTKNKKQYYIVNCKTYPSLSALVKAYRKSPLGLCHILTQPCPKPEPQMWDLGPELRDKWEIPRSEIQLIRKLGQGNFGEVHYGKWRNNIEVAVKTLKEGSMSPQAFLQEASIMKTFRHNRLVALYAVCSTHEPIYIVQEYMSKGSLLEFLRNGAGAKLPFEDLVYIAAQVASGMEYLESKKLIHRDLAARNVLIGENNIAKICDFGLARIGNEYCMNQNTRFPIKWTAPEVILFGTFTIKSDVWSYGILLMELFSYGQVPYPGLSGHETMKRVLKGYRMPKPHGRNIYIPDDIYNTMLRCWNSDADSRPTFEFLNHYFESFTVTSERAYRQVQD